MNNKKYSSKRRVLLSLNELKNYHVTNSIDKEIEKKEEYKKLFNVFKKLDYKYKVFEMFIREIESKPEKSYFDFLILGNYKQILMCKTFMYNKQVEIHEELYNLKHLKYVIHNENKSKVGIPVIEYSKIYFSNKDININWEESFQSIIKNNFGNFYYNLFLFQTCYIIILNSKLGYDNQENFEQFNQLSHNLSKFFKDFNVF